MIKRILISGGAGFIGSHYVDLVMRNKAKAAIVFDALTYAGNLSNLAHWKDDPRFSFIKGDITKKTDLENTLKKHNPDAIVNFAAESHVDRSHLHPDQFIKTNVEGVFNLLEIAKKYRLRYVQVSSDEVYGQVLEGESKEHDPLDTRSPYSASKAAGDLLCRSYYVTYGVDVLVTRGSNTYGPRQYPEKLISLMTTNAILGHPLPVYGEGKQIRDWLHAADHAAGIDLVLRKGKPGQIYNIGGDNLRENHEIVNLIIKHTGASHKQIVHVADRAGHDFRYHVSSQNIKDSIGWKPKVRFEKGVVDTIKWYMANKEWWQDIRNDKAFKKFYDHAYAERLKDFKYEAAR